MAKERKYWKDIGELKKTDSYIESSNREFPIESSVQDFLGDESLQESSTGRRDFLKFF